MKAGCRAAGTAATSVALFFAAVAGASADPWGTTPGYQHIVQGPGGGLQTVAGTPAVTGAPAVGQTLTCDEGDWTGSPAFTYQWLRDGADIGGETGRDHVVVSADADHDLSCHVTGTNDDGSDEATSAEVHVPAVTPQSTSPTTISGTPAVGQTLTCTPGSFSGAPAPAVAIAWLRDGQAIAAQSGTTYGVVAGDAGHALACRATATNTGGSASSTSQSLSVPAALTAGTPDVTGTPAVGQTVTCTEGSWGGSPAFTYTWLRDGTAIGGATGRTYVVDAADATHRLACRVTGTAGGANLEATSATAAVPAVAPVPTTSPAIGGTAEIGETLTCAGASFSGIPAPSTTIQWLRDGAPIAGSTGPSYAIVAADAGHALTCRVTATNPGGSATGTSAAVDIAKPLGGSTPGEIGGAFGLPPARRCVKGKGLELRLRAPAGIRIERIRVLVNGKRLAVRKRGGRYETRVDLKRFPKGRFTVVIRVSTDDGRVLKGKRGFKVCSPKHRPGEQRTDGGES